MNHLAAEGRRGGLGDLARMSQRPEAYGMVAYGTFRKWSAQLKLSRQPTHLVILVLGTRSTRLPASERPCTEKLVDGRAWHAEHEDDDWWNRLVP